MITYTDEQAKTIGRFILTTWDENEVSQLLKIASLNSEKPVWMVKPSLDELFELVCRVHNFSAEQVKKPDRHEDFTMIRHIYAYLAAKIYDPEYIERASKPGLYRLAIKNGLRNRIAKVIGRHPSTVNNSIKVVNNMMETNAAFRRDIEYIEGKIHKLFNYGFSQN